MDVFLIFGHFQITYLVFNLSSSVLNILCPNTLLKNEQRKENWFGKCKNAAQFPFMQPKNTSLVPNTTPFIDFGLNLLATGRIEPTTRISVVMRPLNFSFFNRVRQHPCPPSYQFPLQSLTSSHDKLQIMF